MMPNLQDFQFDSNGLVPVIVQDINTREVLMLAYANAEALALSIETGQSHFWSRSRQELWHKGETSGNYQIIQVIYADCDHDSVLLQVTPNGPACHTGNRSCFFHIICTYNHPTGAQTIRTNAETATQSPDFSLADLYQIIRSRIENPRAGSYTNQLLEAGEDEIIKKIGEESVEVILAAKSQGDQRLIEEVSDLVYHTLVLLASRNISPDAIRAELANRHKA